MRPTTPLDPAPVRGLAGRFRRRSRARRGARAGRRHDAAGRGARRCARPACGVLGRSGCDTLLRGAPEGGHRGAISELERSRVLCRLRGRPRRTVVRRGIGNRFRRPPASRGVLHGRAPARPAGALPHRVRRARADLPSRGLDAPGGCRPRGPGRAECRFRPSGDRRSYAGPHRAHAGGRIPGRPLDPGSASASGDNRRDRGTPQARAPAAEGGSHGRYGEPDRARPDRGMAPDPSGSPEKGRERSPCRRRRALRPCLRAAPLARRRAGNGIRGSRPCRRAVPIPFSTKTWAA